MTARDAGGDGLLVALEDLAVDYGSFRALEAAAVDLPPGAIGLLGPNGAGKSTLIRVLLGLLRPVRVRGRVLGLDIARAPRALRQRIGYMAETEGTIPGLRGLEYVALAGELAGMGRRDAIGRAHEVLTYLGLEEARYRRLDEYSTGMRQRLKLAQALVHDPELLILDEPTNGLDPAGRAALLELVRSLYRDFGKSILLATHLLDDVERVCDHALILDGGRVVANGPLDSLRERWRGRYRLTVSGGFEAFGRALESAGARLLESRAAGGASTCIVEVPEDWPGRRFFEIAAALGEPAAVIREMRRESERLDQAFARLAGAGSRRREEG